MVRFHHFCSSREGGGGISIFLMLQKSCFKISLNFLAKSKAPSDIYRQVESLTGVLKSVAICLYNDCIYNIFSCLMKLGGRKVI